MFQEEKGNQRIKNKGAVTTNTNVATTWSAIPFSLD